MIEREVKLRFASSDEARAAVLMTGATLLRPRRLQEDALLETGDESLAQRGCTLRIRADGGRSLLTFKGPVLPGAMKIRDEFETVVGDGQVLHRVFEALGLRVWFRYQKYREEFAAKDATIAIDETPVGTFVEIEGGEESILAMTTALGRTPADFVLDSYRGLFLKHREEFGLAGAHMVFGAE